MIHKLIAYSFKIKRPQLVFLSLGKFLKGEAAPVGLGGSWKWYLVKQTNKKLFKAF